MEYSTAFKAQMVKKMLGPHGLSANALSQEVGVSQTTLSKWRRQASRLSQMSDADPKQSPPAHSKRAQDWSAAEKMQVVIEAAQLGEGELGAFLRRKGLHRAQLEEWKQTAAAALDGTPPKKGRRSPEQKRIRELERQLRRKDKALAETAALLVLKKKYNALFGDEEDDTESRSDE